MKKLTVFALVSAFLSVGNVQARHLDEASPSSVRIKRILAGQALCLDVHRGSMLDGAKVQQELCVRPSPSGFSEQDFYVTERSAGFYEIRFAKSGKCFQLQGESENAKVVQHSCRGSVEQQFQLVASTSKGTSYQIRARHSGLCLGTAKGQEPQGLALQQAECNSERQDQIFLITEGY